MPVLNTPEELIAAMALATTVDNPIRRVGTSQLHTRP